MRWQAYEVASFRLCQVVEGKAPCNSVMRQCGSTALVSICSTDGVTLAVVSLLDHSYVWNSSSNSSCMYIDERVMDCNCHWTCSQTPTGLKMGFY